MDRSAQPAKPEELAKVYHEVAERAAKVLGEFAKKHPQLVAGSDELGIAKAYMDLYGRMLADPMALAAASMSMWFDYAQLWQSSWMKLLGQDVKPVATPAKGDSRFRDDEWSNNFLFDFIKQSYLIASRHIQHAVSNVEGLPEESEKKVAFFTRQYVDALGAFEFRHDQSAGAARDAFQRRAEPGQGPKQPARGHREGRRAAAHQHDGRNGVQAGQERRHDAGQGRVPDRPDAAGPVRAQHRAGLPAAAADHPAVDQQVLHPRPAREEQLHQVGRRPGPHRVRRLLGQPGPAPRGEGLRRLHARRLARRDRRHRAGDRRVENQRHRLLPRRHAARLHARVLRGEGRGPGRLRDLLRQPARFLAARRARRVHRRRAGGQPREEDERARLPRGLGDGARPSTCCAPTTWCGRSSSTTTCSARTRFRSTCCTGTRIRRACRRRCTASTCATCT